MENLSIITVKCRNIDSNEVDRRSLSSSVLFSKFSGRYFLNKKVTLQEMGHVVWSIHGLSKVFSSATTDAVQFYLEYTSI